MNQNIWGFPNNGSSTFEQTLGYKSYTSLLTQNGVNPPSEKVLGNSLGIGIVWSYIAPGVYMGTLDQNIFTSPDEYVTISGIWSDGTVTANVIQAQVWFVNIIFVNSTSDGVLSDDIIGQTSTSYPPCILEIRKYF